MPIMNPASDVRKNKQGKGAASRDAFGGYHPAVNMLYFTVVMAFGMVFTHPVCLCLSFFCAFCYSVYLKGKKQWRRGALLLLPTLIAAALLNPAFNHRGATILAYLPSQNPLTLESIVYGGAAALMFIAVVSWFTCLNAVMTSDKFVYLFGRVIPALSLTLSMSLRFAPRFMAQLKIISHAQKGLGREPGKYNIFQKIRYGITILSILVTWALENAIETADSMKARGYGLPGRSAFSLYRFNRRDAKALAFVLVCGAYIIAGAAAGGLYFSYFPTINGVQMDAYSLSLFAVYLALGAMPLILNTIEDLHWKHIKSKI